MVSDVITPRISSTWPTLIHYFLLPSLYFLRFTTTINLSLRSTLCLYFGLCIFLCLYIYPSTSTSTSISTSTSNLNLYLHLLGATLKAKHTLPQWRFFLSISTSTSKLNLAPPARLIHSQGKAYTAPVEIFPAVVAGDNGIGDENEPFAEIDGR